LCEFNKEMTMARSSLFAHLQRALKFAAYCEKEGISTDEAYERVQVFQLNRRSFLSRAAAVAGTGMVSAGAAFSRPVLAASASRVVIVGAGCAGLTCAYRLQQAGVMAQVIEASDRIGGRVLTLRDAFPEGQSTELGGEFIDSGHTSLRQLARELGLKLIDLQVASKGLTQEAYYFEGRLIPQREIVDAFRPVAAQIKKDLATLTGDGDVTYLAPNNGEALDRLSLRDWIATRVGNVTLRALLDVAYVGEYGLETDQQSSLNLLFLIGQTPGKFDVFGDSDQRYRIVEGNDSVPRRLAERLHRPVQLGTRLEALRQNSRGTYILTVNQNGRSQDIEADQVVLTLPFSLLRKVDLKLPLPEVKLRAIKTLGYGTNAKIIAGFNRRVWQQQGSQGSAFSDLPFQESWETSLGQPGNGGLLTEFLGGNRGLAANQGTAQEQARAFAAQFDQLYPGTAAAYSGKAVRFHWPSAPFALGSYACYLPGQYTTIRAAEGEAVDNLFFAGEHTSLDFQGYINGASETGERAASEVLAKINKK
jgi:monoamine oxidase